MRHCDAAIAKSGSTRQTMVENQLFYTSIGYEETGRGSEAGYDRVFMRKELRAG
jgi:hypothetical protein